MPCDLKMMIMMIIPKCCNVSFRQTLLLKFTIKTLDRWRHQKRFVTSSLWFKQFLIWSQKANSCSQFQSSIQNTSFFKNLKFGNNVTNNDVIGSKINLFIPALENQLVFKFGSSTAFGLAVEQLRLFDIRWQTVKAEKGESLMSKTRGLFLVAQAMVLSHRVRFQLIIDFFRVSMHFVVFLWNYFVDLFP